MSQYLQFNVTAVTVLLCHLPSQVIYINHLKNSTQVTFRIRFFSQKVQKHYRPKYCMERFPSSCLGVVSHAVVSCRLCVNWPLELAGRIFTGSKWLKIRYSWLSVSVKSMCGNYISFYIILYNL